MKIHKEIPNLFIYTPDRKNIKGMVIEPQEAVFDYSFNTTTQITFKVNKYIYDINNYCWIKNPCYDNLKENMLIATTDNTPKYQFQGSQPYAYSLGTQNYRNSEATGLGYDTVMSNASLQVETELFDIGGSSGYKWQYYSYLDDNGCFIDASGNNAYYNRIACKEFFPVNVGDIIAMGSKISEITGGLCASGKDMYSYKIHFYSEASSSSWVKSGSYSLYSPVGRVRIAEGDFGSYNGKPFTSGYIRIDAIAHQATLNDSGWYCNSPLSNYVKIYSGERRCASIKAYRIKSNLSTTDRWFVIDNIEENSDFINSTKTVTLHSYEYVLSKKSFSISQATLPLYIPDQIPNIVNSNQFIFDAVDGYVYRGKQRMERGLINQILDYIPDWTVGYFSPKVITRYRSVDDIDNGNIYSFLMNTMQSLYQCFIVFDTENKTINLLAKDDITSISSSTILTWSNAMQSCKKVNSDTKYVTAMRIHTAEDQYGIGLINPSGNNTIYNFNSVKDELNFVADPTHYKDDSQTEAYTLREVVELYQKSIEDTINGVQKWGYDKTYRETAKTLIEITQKYTEMATKLSQLLTEYKTIADMINIHLQDDYSPNSVPTNIIISDKPRPAAQMTNGIYAPESDYSNYHSQALYDKLFSASEAYGQCRENFARLTTKKYDCQNHLQYIALMHSLNYKTLKKEYDRCGDNFPYYPIFTPLEILALNHYIYEADWTDNNAVFDEHYSSSDIIDTLVDVYDNAKKELNDIYSKPTYEFTIGTANICVLPEMQESIESLYLGNSLHIIDDKNWIKPVLLSIHIEYDNYENYTFTFSTDYNRKPIEMRFSDLFGTINQINVETPAFTFDN